MNTRTLRLSLAAMLFWGCSGRACPLGYELEGDRCVPRSMSDAGVGDVDAQPQVDARVLDDAEPGDAGETDSGPPRPETCDGIDSDGDSVQDVDDPDAHAWCVDQLPANVDGRCGRLGCYAADCLDTHVDCTDAPGCETASDASNCGACGNVCAWGCGGAACDDVVEISSGYLFSCALRAGGTVWCWGNNADGRLGDGTTMDRSTPVQVVGLTDVVEVDAGEHHACARERDGEVWCWGRNNLKQLGNADASGLSAVPVLAVPASANVVEVAAGGFFNCVRTAAGRVLCWGYDHDGQIGDGEQSTMPVVEESDVGLSGIQSLALGTWHACALRTSGRIVCWGSNVAGQLGDGTSTSRHTVPMQDVRDVVATAIAAGNEHTCALRADGTAICWGANEYGEVGDDTMAWRRAPLNDVRRLRSIAEIDAGHGFTCARTRQGAVHCWGQYLDGRLGMNASAEVTSPPSTPIVVDAVEITARGFNACARRVGGEVVCWGANDHGQIGNGTSGPETGVSSPTPVTPPPG